MRGTEWDFEIPYSNGINGVLTWVSTLLNFVPFKKQNKMKKQTKNKTKCPNVPDVYRSYS